MFHLISHTGQYDIDISNAPHDDDEQVNHEKGNVR